MLICDGCDRGHHIYCLKPKLKSIPKGNWYCNECKPKERIKSPKKKPRKVFTAPEPEPEPEPEEESHLPIPVETLTGLPPPPLGHPMQEPYGRKEQYSPGDKHDWAHHHYPAPRRESREDPRDHHPHPRDPRDHRDPRRLSHDHDRRQSRDLRESSHEHVQSIDDRVSNMQIDNNSAKYEL